MPRCNLCLKNHALRHCPMFQAKSMEARREYIIKWNYCLNCLAQTHSRPTCQSANRCAICGAKHHSSLHRDRPHDALTASFEEAVEETTPVAVVETAPAAFEETAPTAFEETSPEPVDESAPVAVEETAKNITQLPKDNPHDLSYSLSELPTFPPYWQYMIPPIVRVNLIHKGNPMWVNLLLDPKSECSFLIRNVANLFPEFTPDCYQGTKEFGVFDVAATYEPRSHYGPIARWKMLLKDADVIVPPPITDPQLEEHFKSITPKAHPQFAICREIDGIIGQKTLAVIMSHQIIQPTATIPKAQRSIFGWVISGRWHGCICH